MKVVNMKSNNNEMELGGTVACLLGCGSICWITQLTGTAFASVAVVV